MVGREWIMPSMAPSNEWKLFIHCPHNSINFNVIQFTIFKLFHRFVHVDIPFSARTESTRFRLWQPSHRGAGSDQWAVDQIHIGQYHGMHDLQDDFMVMAHLHCRRWTRKRTRIAVLYRNRDPNLSPCNVNMFCKVQCNRHVWNPIPSPYRSPSLSM